MTCEMLDTGLITEPQVPVMNHMRQFLKSTGHMIPTKAITYATLVNEKYDFYGASFRSNHYLRHRIPKPRTMSEKQEVFEAVFRKEVPYNVSKTIDFPVIRDGIVNSLQLETRTILWGDIHIEQATTLNPPVVIPLDGDIPVKKGTDLGLNIEYEHNTGFETVVARSIGSPISISTV
ncbi:hypothetical protein EPN87_01195 [archaeon]|nr:MAG: hypothetical protein EPN87_01195 [archaeon]